jgi:hypothetical protein
VIAKVLFGSLSERGESSDCVLLDNGNADLDQMTKLWHDRLDIVDHDLL